MNLKKCLLLMGILIVGVGGFFGLVVMMSDRIVEFSASGQISSPLDKGCVLEALRAENTLRDPGITNTGIPYAKIVIPENLVGPPHAAAAVEERRNDKGELEIDVSTTLTPYAGTREYQAYVQKVLDDLRDRTIERCGRK